jgi:uncharacterized membrane protein YebE (DUF533 family)
MTAVIVTLAALILAIKEDGVIDAMELEQLKAKINEDGKVDREEAIALFDLNNAVTGQPNDPEYPQFFVDTITDSILEDGVVDPAERALLVNIKAKATGELPANLVEYMTTLGI